MCGHDREKFKINLCGDGVGGGGGGGITHYIYTRIRCARTYYHHHQTEHYTTHRQTRTRTRMQTRRHARARTNTKPQQIIINIVPALASPVYAVLFCYVSTTTGCEAFTFRTTYNSRLIGREASSTSIHRQQRGSLSYPTLNV